LIVFNFNPFFMQFFPQNAHPNDLFMIQSKTWAIFILWKGPKFEICHTWKVYTIFFMQFSAWNWLWQGLLQLIFQWISSNSYGFRVQHNCSKTGVVESPCWMTRCCCIMQHYASHSLALYFLTRASGSFSSDILY
jgi:hypothetical protein